MSPKSDNRTPSQSGEWEAQKISKPKTTLLLQEPEEMDSEAEFHFELYRVIKNLIEKGYTTQGATYTKIIPKKKLDNLKEPDLLLEDSTDRPILVIETKKKEEDKFVEITDPFNHKVIDQACGYATHLGTPFFATCNKDIFVLFKTWKEFVPLYQRQTKIYRMSDFKDRTEFVKTLLSDITELQKPESAMLWTPDYEVLIARLKYLHKILVPQFESTLLKILKSDGDFEKRYKAFLEKEGFAYSDVRNRITAEEASYLIINKIFFYKTIENKYGKINALKRVKELEKTQQILQEHFDNVAENVDFKGVFLRKSLYNEIPFTKEASNLLNEFIEELNQYKLDEINSDIMGMVYKNIIPKDEKKEFGQYYTDADIAKLITSLCINDKGDMVLDCACGSGTFLIESYNILKNMNRSSVKSEEELHNKILGQLLGVEINQFPAHLSVMQLTMQNIRVKTDIVNIIIRDFFKVQKKDPFQKQHTKNLDDELIQKEIMPQVDVVVANPPYIRQEAIKEKEYIRKTTLINGMQEYISGRSDIYVYFFIKALDFLKDNGRLGFITSNSYLDVEFGEGIKKRFLDSCCIDSVIAFDKDVFEDAVVNTCITTLRKTKDVKERDKNLVSFVRIKKKIDGVKIQKLISTKKSYEDEEMRVIVINQSALTPEQKWTPYHRAPPIYFEIASSNKIVKLSDKSLPEAQRIARVWRAYTTNANRFFILSKEKVKVWGIEKKYLKPVITSPKKFKTPIIKETDAEEYLLMVNKPKSLLKDEGAKVLNYILNGEKTEITIGRGTEKGSVMDGYHGLTALSRKEIWYALEEENPAPILFQKMYREKILVFHNKDLSYCIDNFSEIAPIRKEYVYPLLAFFNSSIGELCIELNGRYPGNGLLELMVYEIESLPVLNPQSLTKSQQRKLKKAFISFSKEGNKRILDDEIYKILKIGVNEQRQIRLSLDELKEIRQWVKKPDATKEILLGTNKATLIGKKKEVKQMTSLKRWLKD